MIFERWDVVAVDFPFVEGTDAKRRPALVVSSDRLHAEQGLYWAVMITTAKSGAHEADIAVTMPGRVNLPENCYIRPARLMTIAETRIGRKIGTITANDRTAVSAQLRRYLP